MVTWQIICPSKLGGEPITNTVQEVLISKGLFDNAEEARAFLESLNINQ